MSLVISSSRYNYACSLYSRIDFLLFQNLDVCVCCDYIERHPHKMDKLDLVDDTMKITEKHKKVGTDRTFM